jgi:hypothetical protein
MEVERRSGRRLRKGRKTWLIFGLEVMMQKWKKVGMLNVHALHV